MVLTSNQASPDTEALPMSLGVWTQGVGGGGKEEEEEEEEEKEAITAYLSFSCGFLSFKKEAIRLPLQSLCDCYSPQEDLLSVKRESLILRPLGLIIGLTL